MCVDNNNARIIWWWYGGGTTILSKIWAFHVYFCRLQPKSEALLLRPQCMGAVLWLIGFYVCFVSKFGCANFSRIFCCSIFGWAIQNDKMVSVIYRLLAKELYHGRRECFAGLQGSSKLSIMTQGIEIVVIFSSTTYFY